MRDLIERKKYHKSKTTRERMAEAKLNVSKSEEHKENMRKAGLLRCERIRDILEENEYRIDWKEAQQIYMLRKAEGTYE